MKAGATLVAPETVHLAADTKLGRDSVVEPYVVFGPGVVVEEGAVIRSFSHLEGATVGAGANIGAGTITCNYDGFNKHKTDIGSGAFIGSNSSLVAPVKIGNGAYVASGSVITGNVPDDSLGVARTRQVNKEGWAKDLRALKGKGDGAD
jgi:bifunctional UDP-N-acetylglucosamine pyrophosphorylase/glucosamine-1-phosphate N-acetyltransferase